MKILYLLITVSIILQTSSSAQEGKFPLDIGNKWYYQACASYQSYYGAIKEITDTLSDGTRVITAKYFYNDSTSTKKENWRYSDGQFYIFADRVSSHVYNDYITRDSCKYPESYLTNTCWKFINYKIFGINYTSQELSGIILAHGRSIKIIDVIPDIGIVKTVYKFYATQEPPYIDSTYLVGMYRNGVVLGDTTLQNPSDTAVANFPLELGQKWTYHLVCNNKDKNEKVIREITKILDNGFREITATYLYKDSTIIKKEYWLSKDRKFYMSDTPDLSPVELSYKLCYNAALMVRDCITSNDGRKSRCIEWKTDNFNFKNKLYEAQYFTVPWKSHIIANNIGPVSLKFWSSITDNRIEDLLDITTDLNIKNHTLPKSYSLSQNYPNPFNPATVISYQLPVTGSVTLKVYDVLGKEVATLVNEEKPAGYYNVKFDGSSLSNGVYFYRLQSGSFVETKKFILLK